MKFSTGFFKTLFALLIAITQITSALAQDEATIKQGETLFKKNCASCHNRDMKSDMTGPALGGVQDRWESEELLYAWIRNSQAVVASGDSYATSLFNTWNKSIMTSFPSLKDEEIASILTYIGAVNDGIYPKQDNQAVSTEIVDISKKSSGLSTTTWVYMGIIAFLLFLGLILFNVSRKLDRASKIKNGIDPGPRQSILQALSTKGMITLLIFGAIIIGGIAVAKNAISLGRQQNYQPTQPIKFSHLLHAGENEIDCEYCHDGARRSKHSVIPATNTCMNCHKQIEYGPEHGTAEIGKIYASAGFNPITKEYADMSTDKAEKIFKEWIAAKHEATYPERGDAKEVADEQWDAIAPQLNQPIEWVKIHNLPDHVYFNHAQHVTAGNIACQDCHGNVENMSEVFQYAPLSMGWCVNCHRQTEVQFADNNYYQYQSFQELHDAAAKGDKITVEKIGGLECQKCHY